MIHIKVEVVATVDETREHPTGDQQTYRAAAHVPINGSAHEVLRMLLHRISTSEDFAQVLTSMEQTQ
jgi:hypothetical protein